MSDTQQPSQKNILKALFDFQNEDIKINKDTKGYGYNYASLDKISEIIKPHLKKHGLLWSQPINGKLLITRIYHVDSGEYIESSIELDELDNITKSGEKKMNNIQALGASITYLRRYSLISILGLVTDEDTDGRTDKDKPNEHENSRPATSQTPSSGQNNDLPWLTEDQYKAMLKTIEAGDIAKVEEGMKRYKMKNIYKEDLTKAIEKKKSEGKSKVTLTDVEKALGESDQTKEQSVPKITSIALIKLINECTTLEALNKLEANYNTMLQIEVNKRAFNNKLSQLKK